MRRYINSVLFPGVTRVLRMRVPLIGAVQVRGGGGYTGSSSSSSSWWLSDLKITLAKPCIGCWNSHSLGGLTLWLVKPKMVSDEDDDRHNRRDLAAVVNGGQITGQTGEVLKALVRQMVLVMGQEAGSLRDVIRGMTVGRVRVLNGAALC